MNYTHYRPSQTENIPQNFKSTHSRIEAISPEWLDGAQLFYKRPFSQCLATTFNCGFGHITSSAIRIGGIYYHHTLHGDILVYLF